MSRAPASYTNGINRSFVLTEKDIKAFCEIIKSYSEDVEVLIECEDGVDREPTVKQLLEYQNSASKQINLLRLSSKGDQEKHVSLSFRRKTWMGLMSPISIQIRGSDEVLTRYRERIEESLDGLRPWYDRLTRIDAVSILCATFVLFILTCFVLVAGFMPDRKPVESTKMQAFANLLAIALIVTPFLAGFLLNHLRDLWFPPGVFAINDGLKRHQTADNWRWILISSVVIPIVFGIVSLIWSVFL
ncbi:hypothetical protein Plim_3961 [Planctopirus limnophila DSM 3776]|uniref:Uncharacterized protein n=1 Tax=Planctopirus limnophila (strain ATCC 43296 / DSM 3776 / IFAM 1008 / Mu 290) TaxID=521674 RepID=D5SXX9_PLAL2|nr:hypothetical protein [Planctopirus limnophila]ADG69772.1 hypothetical protein Plim_3961 [Planctopirus limnophila DSM 3776]